MKPEFKKEWLDRAQHDIDRAIEINAYAHGMREYAQAAVLLGDFSGAASHLPS